MLSDVQEILQGMNPWILFALAGVAALVVILGDVTFASNRNQIDAPDAFDVPLIEAVVLVAAVVAYFVGSAGWALLVWVVMMLLSIPVIGAAVHLRKLQAERTPTWSPKPPNRTKV